MKQITEAQEIYLRMIEAGGCWNNFNGARIAAELREHLHLWRSAVITSLPYILKRTAVGELRDCINLVVLRDLPDNHINMDPLFILCEPGQQDELERLAHGWCADEVSWISRLEGIRAMGASKFQFSEYPPEESRFLLRAWWD